MRHDESRVRSSRELRKKKEWVGPRYNGRRTFGFVLFSLPTRSCCLSALRLLCLALSFFTRRPLLRLTWWWWWWFSFIHLLLRTHHDTTFFEDDAKEKKVVSYCLASLLFHYSLNQGPNVVRGSIRKRVSRLAIAHSIFVHLRRSLLSNVVRSD